VTFLELIAQSYAAFKGYMDLLEGKPAGTGFLVGVRHMEFTGRAYAGDRLRTSIRTVTSFGGFAVVEGTVTRGDETIASGSIKLWLVEDGR
jgi:predicted hotdog family 3-hydroxylacyl-ACP dehydratase